MLQVHPCLSGLTLSERAPSQGLWILQSLSCPYCPLDMYGGQCMGPILLHRDPPGRTTLL